MDPFGYVVMLFCVLMFVIYTICCTCYNTIIVFNFCYYSEFQSSFSFLSFVVVNFLIIESLERYYFYYGDDLKVELPTGSGNLVTLLEASKELCRRIGKLFVPDANGRRPCHGDDPRYQDDPFWKDLILFYEYFDGDTGRGCGARYVSGCGHDGTTM